MPNATKKRNDRAVDIPMLAAARNYAQAGLSVFPLRPGQKKPPLTVHGFKDATINEAQIISWWTDTPTANIGIATGISNLVVIDYDPRNDPKGESLRKLEQLVGPALWETAIVATPSGGRHFYFRCPEGKAFKSGNNVLGPGLDIKSDGGYVVAPPSKLSNGTYTWCAGHGFDE